MIKIFLVIKSDMNSDSREVISIHLNKEDAYQSAIKYQPVLKPKHKELNYCYIIIKRELDLESD